MTRIPESVYRTIFFCVCIALAASSSTAQSRQEMREGRQKGWSDDQVTRWLDYHASGRLELGPNDDCTDYTTRRDAIMNGNAITTQVFNFGSISAPGNTITNVVWNGLGYGYEFGPFVAAEIVDTYREDGRRRDPQSVPLLDDDDNVVLNVDGDTTWVMRIVSDGLVSLGGEISPDGSEYWGWQPIPCAQPVGSFAGLQVVNPSSDKIPTNDAPDDDLDGKPDSWPESWYNENLERYVWPGALQQGASNADKELLYFMNDYNNREFAYYPFPSDSTKRGLGLEVEVRMYQWANPLAEDALFMVYKITNKSEKDLDKVIFGMWGDPHIGGPNDWQDDLAYFDRELNMVYAWDADGKSDIAGRTPGYFGFKFLESPGIDYDGIDNDNDGMIDESWTDGIDNDGDWDPETDDVGIDGIPGTGDFGEGDGVPTAGDPYDITKPGEPNFEFTDLDESDQVGLTSFASPPFAGNAISNDERVWSFVQPGRFDEVPEEPGDYVFVYGSGPIRLLAGETKRFSVALILGENFDDLTLNARTVQQIYESGYRFARPPEKPIVRAVPGDGKVTLYWDAGAEDSVDPLTGEKDFEGYVIYRSTDHEFRDQRTVTDVYGTSFLYQPLTNSRGVPAKFDLDNGITGPSPIPFPNRGVAFDLGNDTGLYHTYVDSNNVVNGQTYYYAVTAYDRGYAGAPGEPGIPPSETSKTITYDPTTDRYVFDVNTVMVTPRPKPAGYVPAVVAEDGLERVAGHGTGDITLRLLDELAVRDNNQYSIRFDDTGGEIRYSVVNETPVTVEFGGSAGRYVSLGHSNIIRSSFEVVGATGNALEEGKHYVLNDSLGSINISQDAMSSGPFTATFKYMPIRESGRIASEEANPVFDGMHLFVENDPLRIDEESSGWASGTAGHAFAIRESVTGSGGIARPYDYEIRFADSDISESVNTGTPAPFEVYNLTRGNEKIRFFFADTSPRNGRWDVGEPISFFEEVNGTDRLTWQVTFSGSDERPGAGDVFYVATHKPFAEDVFAFNTRGALIDGERMREQLRDIYAVPNPYVVTNELEPRNPVSRTERGDRRMYFANVPPQCTIRIYTLAGELVDVIHHDSSIDDGKVFWDLRSKDNMNIAYGLYLFHVESPEGDFTGKFAVIK